MRGCGPDMGKEESGETLASDGQLAVNQGSGSPLAQSELSQRRASYVTDDLDIPMMVINCHWKRTISTD